MKKLLWLVTLFYFSPVYADWWFNVVDTGVWRFGSGIDVDSLGRAHIVYYEKYRAFNPDDSIWVLQYEHGCLYPTIKLDSKGLPHIVGSKGGSDYIWKDTNEVWHEENDVPSLHQGAVRGFDLDSENYPHIVYVKFYPDTLLKYCWKDISGWHEEIIDSLHSTAYTVGISAVIDDEDVIHIAYPFSTRIYYAKKVGNVWYKEIIEPPSSGYSLSPSLALDTLGNPCIAWNRCASPGYLKFASRDSLGWQVEVVDSIYTSNPVLCIDKDNNPRIFYNNYKYAWFNGNSWNYTILFDYKCNKSKSTSGSGPSMEVDDENFSHICVTLHDSLGRVMYMKGHGFMGVEENYKFKIADSRLQIYPNPFIQFAEIRCQISGVRLQIYDMVGRLVEETNVGLEDCKIGESLPAGIYFVKAKGYKTTKVIKMGGVR